MIECCHCRFWADMGNGDVGECRFRSPVHVDEEFCGLWPKTYHVEWCGQAEPLEDHPEDDHPGLRLVDPGEL